MRAFLLGGSGSVGRATCRRLIAAGWEVEVVGRDPRKLPPDLTAAGVRFRTADRDDAQAIGRAFGGGADLLVDCVCFTAAQATSLLPMAALADSTVMISSKAVYADSAGRHTNSDSAPCFRGAIRETQATVPPGDLDFNSREGYGRNKVAAEHVLLDSGLPVTVLRPSKVHGEGARPPREWIFVKRVLDRRPVVLLARGGRGIDHPSAAANVAALIETVAHRPGRRLLNAADPDAPSALDIARVIARSLDHQWDEVLLDDWVDDSLGRHPWDAKHPIVLDMTAAGELGYLPAGNFQTTAEQEVKWLVRSASGTDRNELPAGYDATFFGGMFDYAAEDAWLRGRVDQP